MGNTVVASKVNPSWNIKEIIFSLLGEDANQPKPNDKKASDEKPVVHIKSKMVIGVSSFLLRSLNISKSFNIDDFTFYLKS